MNRDEETHDHSLAEKINRIADFGIDAASQELAGRLTYWWGEATYGFERSSAQPGRRSTERVKLRLNLTSAESDNVDSIPAHDSERGTNHLP